MKEFDPTICKTAHIVAAELHAALIGTIDHQRNLRRLAPKLRDNREFQEAVIAAIETIHELERQVIEMARTNVGNVKILTDKIAADQVALDAATKAAKTQDEVDALAAAAAAANAITPDTAPAASTAA